jgi:hypothetical protein
VVAEIAGLTSESVTWLDGLTAVGKRAPPLGCRPARAGLTEGKFAGPSAAETLRTRMAVSLERLTY